MREELEGDERLEGLETGEDGGGEAEVCVV